MKRISKAQSRLIAEAIRIVDNIADVEDRMNVKPTMIDPSKEIRDVDNYIRDLRIEQKIKELRMHIRLALKVYDIKNLFPSPDGEEPLKRAKEISRTIDKMSDGEITVRLDMKRD
tara:strand:+ start:414 stop:758 length:345 start_codon:yes stop_codon:yes gene_type:complete